LTTEEKRKKKIKKICDSKEYITFEVLIDAFYGGQSIVP